MLRTGNAEFPAWCEDHQPFGNTATPVFHQRCLFSSMKKLFDDPDWQPTPLQLVRTGVVHIPVTYRGVVPALSLTPSATLAWDGASGFIRDAAFDR